MAEHRGGTLVAAVAGDVLKAHGLYNETLAFLRIASDHAKFIRNFADPTQEALFRQADGLAAALDALRAELGALQEPVPPTVVFALVQRTVPILRALVQFKESVARRIRSCQVQHLLPAPVVDHLRREVDFYLGIVDHVLGQPTLTRRRLNLPGPALNRVSPVARALIDKSPLTQAVAANLTWTEFWGGHHMEHAEILTHFLRPREQQLIRGATEYRKRFAALLEEAAAIDLSGSAGLVEQLNRATLLLADEWRRFLSQALAAQRSCGRQENFPQRLTEHMIIESDLLAESTLRAQARIEGRALSGIPAAGATYDQVPEKATLLS